MDLEKKILEAARGEKGLDEPSLSKLFPDMDRQHLVAALNNLLQKVRQNQCKIKRIARFICFFDYESEITVGTAVHV